MFQDFLQLTWGIYRFQPPFGLGDRSMVFFPGLLWQPALRHAWGPIRVRIACDSERLRRARGVVALTSVSISLMQQGSHVELENTELAFW